MIKPLRPLKPIVKSFVRRLGFDLVPYRDAAPFPPDFDLESIRIIQRIRPYTMTSVERAMALIQAVRYVIGAKIPGSIVECGVWRGGSMMAAALTLQQLGVDDRELYLFDTYAGMPRPTDADINIGGAAASVTFERVRQGEDSSAWCYASLEDVQQNLFSTGYRRERLNFIQGKVEETIPAAAPSRIAILRLDTDWYESTRHELIHLYPRLSTGGVLLLDDYGHWQGSRRAVDEYFQQNGITLLLNRVDYTGRVAIKC